MKLTKMSSIIMVALILSAGAAHAGTKGNSHLKSKKVAAVVVAPKGDLEQDTPSAANERLSANADGASEKQSKRPERLDAFYSDLVY